MEASLYDKIAFSLAQEVGFTCYKQREGEYSFRKEGIGCGPCLYGRSAGPNPCGEVPLEWYELCIEIDGSWLFINGVIKFDLNDPNSIEKFKAELADTEALRKKVENLRQGHPAEGYVYKGFDNEYLMKHSKLRLEAYKRRKGTW